MLRARVRLGAALTGFLIVLIELGFAVYVLVWQLHSPLILAIYVSPIEIYLPLSLLALASLIGGVALIRVLRGRSHRSLYVAALLPVAVFLSIYSPPMSLDQLARVSTLPWVAPAFWTQAGNPTLSLGLQVGMYVAAAAYVLAIVLALPWRQSSPSSHQGADGDVPGY